jgi:hypothetical protein
MLEVSFLEPTDAIIMTPSQDYENSKSRTTSRNFWDMARTVLVILQLHAMSTMDSVYMKQERLGPN